MSASESVTVQHSAVRRTISSPAEPDARAWRDAAIGRYLAIEELGRGGMGVVLRAYDPKLQREVALKVMRVDAMTDEAKARMIREARAMAKLSHPNVVAIYDAEIRAQGVVLAMEYVPGTTLHMWLRLGPRAVDDILAAFVEAGRGLAAAHAEGLLHRDFKPANVVVTVVDDRIARVKVTDFGLARAEAIGAAEGASDHDDTADVRSSDGVAVQLTQTATVMGTPRYMAPEQHAGGELSAATDQYAFCVSLWEALTGTPPFEGPAMERSKRSGPPAWPRAGVHPAIVDALRRGLAPRPGDRFPDMPALLAALTRDPAARNKWWLGGLAVVGTLALVGTSVHQWVEGRASRCSGAAARLAGVWDDARRGEVEAAVLGTRTTYAADTWSRVGTALDSYADEWVRMHTDACEATTVRGEQSTSVMDRRMECLHAARRDLRAAVDVLARADAEIVRNAHEAISGLPSVSRCADIDALRSDVPPPPAEEASGVAEIREALAESSARRRTGKYVDALAALGRAEARLATVAYEPVRTELELERGRVQDDLGNYVAAETALRAALRSATMWSQWDTAGEAAMQLMEVVGYRHARFAEGLAFADLARGLADRSGNPSLQADFHDHLGTVLHRQAKYAEAEGAHTTALRLRETTTASDPVATAMSHNGLASALYEQGEYAAAEQESRTALALWQEAVGPEHPLVADAYSNVASALVMQSRHAEAEQDFRTALRVREQALGLDHPEVAIAHNNLAAALAEQGRFAEAIAEYRAAMPVLTKNLGVEHPDVATAHSNLANFLHAQRRPVEAEVEHRIAWELRLKALGPEHPDTIASQAFVGHVLLALGRLDEARPLLEAALRARQGPDALPQDRATTASWLARVLWQQGEHTRARELVERALQEYVVAGPAYADEHRMMEKWLRDRR